jgi:hypothetical protein
MEIHQLQTELGEALAEVQPTTRGLLRVLEQVAKETVVEAFLALVIHITGQAAVEVRQRLDQTELQPRAVMAAMALHG